MYSSQEKTSTTYDSSISKSLSETLRVNFVRKVFGITTVQLIFTSIFTYFCYSNSIFARFNSLHNTLSILSFILVIGICLALGLSDSLSRKVPVNYVLLGIFTLAEAYSVAYITSQYDEKIVLTALFLTAVVVFTLTLYAFQSKTEITYFRGLITLFSLGILMLLFLSLFVGHQFTYSLIFASSCVLTGLYFIYDIKLIMGNDRAKLTLDDYIRGSMVLYLDIVKIFLKILKILEILNQEGKDNKRDKKR